MREEDEQVPDLNDVELVDYVRGALKSAAQGDREQYEHLYGLLHHDRRLSLDESALLVTSLEGLSAAVSHIDNAHHQSLLNTIFSMTMWNNGPDVMDAQIQLIVSLAATNGSYLDSCLRMLVSNFLPPPDFLQILRFPRGVTRKEQVMERVHLALLEIGHLIPLAPSRLFPIIREGLPYYTKPEALLVLYAENILKLESSTLGQLVGSLLLIMIVVDRLIDLDVEIGWDLILSDDPTKGIFEIELDGEDIEETENDGVAFHRVHFLSGNVMADKLDSLMVLTFEYLKSSYEDGRLVEVFESLLQSFQRTILNAYKSKFAQFVMFYACSLDPEICGVRFALYLADVFTSTTFPLLTRMSAVAYLASYMARANYLTTSFITGMLERLSQWCSEYCQTHNGAINPNAHRAFYAGCQGIMYVLCFRMRSIIEVPHLKSKLHLMPLGQILKNSYDPLEVCLPSIVAEFTRQAKAAHLLDARAFVTNDELESELSRAYGGVERLDMFFPFDPCLLQRSDKYVQPNFVSWVMVKPTYNEDEENDTDDNFSDEGSPRGMAESFEERDYFDEFNTSLNKMSITPKNSSFMKFGDGLMKMPSRIRPSTSPESL